MSDQSPTSKPAFDQSTLFDDPTPKRVAGPAPDEKGSPILLVVLVLVLVAVVGGLVYAIATSSDDEKAQTNDGPVTLDPVERFHERTADLFDESVPLDQREAIGRSVCEFVETSSNPATVQEAFRRTWGEADVKLLFAASANAWCPQHAGVLATG